MALEAVVFQQELFGYNTKDLYNLFGGSSWNNSDFGVVEKQEVEVVEEEEEEKIISSDFLENQTESCHHYAENWNSQVPNLEQWGPCSSSLESQIANTVISEQFQQLDTSKNVSSVRPKRRRSKSRKNQEEIENQRITHIAVERNRRKQMNEYLSVLRSIMPDSYVPRGDQASIVGGAINYVKELEQHLQSLSGKNYTMNQNMNTTCSSSSSLPFSEFFTFPQYTTTNPISLENSVATKDLVVENGAAIAEIEVTMVETHANLKIRSKRRPKQLLKLVSGLQSLRLSILHLNVTTVEQIVLYSMSVKVEDDCKLTSVDEIASAVNQLLGRIQEEAIFC